MFSYLKKRMVSRGRTSTAKHKHAEKVISSKEPSTYRVSGVPLGWDRERLQAFLMSQENLADAAFVASLAHEANTESQTATVTFENAYISRWPGGTYECSLPHENSDNSLFDRFLSIEKDFIGLTTLYEPPSRDHKIDIIALSGLGGHAFGSFKQRGKSHMWLRDSLPGYLTSEADEQPMARVMIYGYESTVARSKSVQNLEDLATTFHSSLLTLAAGRITRPIILIGHSLGGLIIKQSLISLSSSTIPDDQRLIRAVYGVIFFGTPHYGMNISSLIPMVGDGPNRFLIESISHINSQITDQLQEKFYQALGKEGDSEVFCFYETLESPTAQEIKPGEWKMNGPTAVLVTKNSATRCRPWENGSEHICAIARTHSDMVKFGPHDSDLKNVKERIRGLSRRAFGARDRLQTTMSKFLIPYRKNPDFVGRSKTLNEVKSKFGLGQQREDTQLRRRVSLYGLGGVGKTQLAIAYVYWMQETCPDVSVFWVHASNADRFRAAYASIAEKCSMPGREDPKTDILSLVKKWLEEQNKLQWLMIIDNADDIELFFPSQKSDVLCAQQEQGDRLARYIPDCNHGSILLTTRNKQVGIKFGQGNSLIEVTKMTDNEAHQLVQTLLKTEVSTDEISLLASRLEHLPLALVQATSFIQENTISINNYVQLLDEGDTAFVDQLSEPFETVGRDSETPQALTATWIISFRKIEQTQPLASDTLCFLSLLHHQAIPKIFTEGYHRQRKPEHSQGSVSAGLIKALGTLKAFSFISEGKDGSVDMHRLVQLVTRKWLVNNSRMNEFAEYAINVVASSFPMATFDTFQACLIYIPHVNSVLTKDGTSSKAENIDRALLLFNLAKYYYHKGEWKNEERYLLLAEKIRAQELGKDHPKTLSCNVNLALSYHYQGRFEEAEALVLRTIETQKRVEGEDHPNTLNSLGNLALTYMNQGRFKDAEQLFLQVVEREKRVLGEDHPITFTSMCNLAMLYVDQDRFKDAEDLFTQIIKKDAQVVGEGHMLVSVAMGNFALLYQKQGLIEEAIDLSLRVIEIRKRVLGENHPYTFSMMTNLANMYLECGRLKEAEDLGKQVIPSTKQVLGEDHEETMRSMYSHVLVYLQQERWKEATDLEIQATKVRKRVLGEEHQDTLRSMTNLAYAHYKEGRLKEAEDLAMQVLELGKRVLGEEHPDTLWSKYILAHIWKESARPADAMVLMEECLSARERILGENHPDTVSSLSDLKEWRREAWGAKT